MNVNGIAEHRKRELIFDFVKSFNVDFICLQETHNDSEKNKEKWTRDRGGGCIWSRATNRSRGVGILLKPGSELIFGNIRKDSNGRIVAATLLDRENNPKFNMINLYATAVPRDRKDFFADIWRYKPGDLNLLLVGDFNCVVNTSLDKQGGNPDSGTAGIEELTDFTNNHNLVDIWRETHPQDRIFTWNNKNFTQRSRLDRWYVPRGQDTQATIRACPHSDHSVIEITWKLRGGKKRGKGSWKLSSTKY